MRRELSVLAWATALLHLACGRVDYPGGDGDGSTTSSLECFDGELRLSETPCEDGEYLVERCQAEVWQATEECRVPEVPCNEGEVIETEELCGEYQANPDKGGVLDYNRVLEGCRGGVRQRVGCTCGAEGSGGAYETETVKEGKLEGQILGIEGVPYPGLLAFLGPEVKTDLSHVRCIGSLVVWGSGLDELTGVVAINRIVIALNEAPLVVPPLPTLRKLNELFVFDGEFVDLSGFERLTRLGELSIRTSADVDLRGLRSLRELDVLAISTGDPPIGITSLEGLEGITRVRRIGVTPESKKVGELPALLNYTGLKNLEYVEEGISVRRSAEGLRGLESLRSVGSLSADIVDEADIDVLSNLEEVRGDMVLNLADDQLRCSVPRLLEHVTVSGTITVDGLAWEDIKSRCEE